MSRKFSSSIFYFCKRNSAKIFYATSSVSAAAVYYINKDTFLTGDKRPAHALSLWPFGKSDIDLSDVLEGTISDEKEIYDNKEKMRYKMEAYVTNLQGKIIKELQKYEPEHKFLVDKWARKEGGGGVTCIVQDGETFERAAVNVSVVKGVLPAEAVQAMRSRGKTSIPSGKELPFFACGISSVVHPRNPNVPTVHFNYRFFEIEVGENKYESWFGGGTDLTPYYLDHADVMHFHSTLKIACDKHDSSYYSKFKKWCDDYFVIPHRGERRGVGGIFFDDIDYTGGNKEFDFVRTCGDAVMPSFVPILVKNKDKGYGLKERDWQLLRRGRYVEFNLIYDRGTKFGLLTPGARIEAILVSLPLAAKWTYKHELEKFSPEYNLTEVLKNPQEWIV